ncbi:SDR family oxidoreductase [Desmospora activa]|uniref:3-oxoacyl-[acyl-carrier protein] reductase n=1 Tax=Desmospora activa DSM 45169 TaxID=1121389 RepID=A0A2T4Z721_9BACL|nr:SDR family oxidoreductase [Desmospora activa]PTM57692.1 3-oxoacyl-[acyl-carrier protein] reductase [Desmospora activa DSM 45169]
MGEYHNPVVLVTGSSYGLGKMTALVLAEAGWTVAVHHRDSEEKGREVVSRICNRGGQAHLFQGDLLQSGTPKRLVDQVVEKWGRLDALVYAVGPFVRERRRFADYRQEEVESLVTGNLTSAMMTVHAALPVMRQSRFGRIVLFGFGRVGEVPAWPDRAVYAAAKTGLASFTKTVAVEEASFGITVNMVCPGDIVGENKERRIRDVRDRSDEETPLGRPGSGEDVARVIRFLCARDADFTTGNVIAVTGALDVIHPVSKAPLGESER